ncbi:MAG TPA: hypothetical protein VJU58_04095 [Microbacterium sp.]|nr:hypothetical protein [Microbacterium sp.]
MITLLAIKLADDAAERVRQSHAQGIVELQGLPASATVVINDVQLPDNVVVLIPHRLGRRPRITLHSPPRGAATIGLVSEVIDVAGGNPDRTKFIALRANGMGATITVDVEVK